jgi:hypothetical protein
VESYSKKKVNKNFPGLPKPYFGTPNMKKHFSSVKTKIDLRGDPRHPDGHARVRYGLVPTNYAMLTTEFSSFKTHMK